MTPNKILLAVVMAEIFTRDVFQRTGLCLRLQRGVQMTVHNGGDDRKHLTHRQS